jgi:prophage regulatory protein
MTKHSPIPPRRVILRRPQVEEKTGLARSTIYKLIADGDFPAPINLAPRTVGWVESEIESWLESRTRMVPRRAAAESEAA